MIHFLKQIILCHGKKIISLIIVVAFLLILFCPCEGYMYKINFSTEDLESGLLSIEVIEFYYRENTESKSSDFVYNVIFTIDTEEEKNIVQTLSEIDFIANTLPFRQSKYGLKLNYADKHIVFSKYEINNLDVNHNFIIGKDSQHNLSMNNKEYDNLLEKYVVDIYAEQETIKS